MIFFQNPQMFIARKESDGRRDTNSLEKLFAGHHKTEIGWRQLKSILDQLVKSGTIYFASALSVTFFLLRNAHT